MITFSHICLKHFYKVELELAELLTAVLLFPKGIKKCDWLCLGCHSSLNLKLQGKDPGGYMEVPFTMTGRMSHPHHLSLYL